MTAVSLCRCDGTRLCADCHGPGCVLCGGTGEVGEVWQDRDGLIHDERLYPCPACATERELGAEPDAWAEHGFSPAYENQGC